MSPPPAAPPAPETATAELPRPRARASRKVAALPVEGAAAPVATSPAPFSPEAELFARATAARRDGRPAEAIALFHQLEREMPATPEAVVSLVSLGNLLVDAGDAQAALASFDAYLRRSPTGALAPEALAARARALDRLGRADEALAARRELARRFPRSAYKTGGAAPSPGAPP